MISSGFHKGEKKRKKKRAMGQKPYVRGLPHRLQLELLDTSLIGGNGGALDADPVLLDGLRSIDSDWLRAILKGKKKYSVRNKKTRR